MADPISILANSEGKYDHAVLFIGGHALQVHGYLRNTNDVDVLTSRESLDSVMRNLIGLGYRKHAETPIFVRFVNPDIVFPDIDVLVVDSGVFEKLYQSAESGVIQSTSVKVPSVLHLIALKLHAIRNDPERELRDLSDIRELIVRNRGEIDEDGYQEVVEKYATDEIAKQIAEWLTI